MTDLSQKHCVPCEGGIAAFTKEEAQIFLRRLPEWQLSNDGLAISRSYKFSNFKKALAFVNQLGELAEAEGHHPDIAFGWGYVHVTLTTHAINGLSENDFIIATKSDTHGA